MLFGYWTVTVALAASASVGCMSVQPRFSGGKNIIDMKWPEKYTMRLLQGITCDKAASKQLTKRAADKKKKKTSKNEG